MVFLDGWVAVQTLTKTIYLTTRDYVESYFEDEERRRLLPGGIENSSLFLERMTEGMVSQYVWEVCQGLDKCAILTGTGSLVYADIELLSCWDPNELDGYYVHLVRGTVGSGSGIFDPDPFHGVEVSMMDADQPPTIMGHRCGELLNNFVGCPVMIPEPDFRQAQTNYTFSDVSNIPSRPHDEIIDEIIQLHDAGEKLTKKWVRANLAPDMKVLEFNSVWSMAATARPALSKPGPRGRKAR